MSVLREAMFEFVTWPVYSVDTSSLIALKDHYPEDRFPSMWELVRRLARDGWLLASEEVAGECHDRELKDLFEACPGMEVDFGRMQDYFRTFMCEAQNRDILLIDPESTGKKNEADPFVVALALWVEQRHLHNLRSRTDADHQCAVVTEEKRSKPGAKPLKIPNVCSFYHLSCIKWLDLLKHEGYVD